VSKASLLTIGQRHYCNVQTVINIL